MATSVGSISYSGARHHGRKNRATLLDAFDRQRQVDLAARLVARHLTLGHSPQALIATLAGAVLREDAGFHAYQMLEAGVRQFTAWGNTDAGRHILIAVVRYLAAHSPTERAALQTADIARRLMLGQSCIRRLARRDSARVRIRAWRPDRCVHRTRDAADRRVDLVSPSSRLHARRPRPHHADVGSRLSCLRRACRDTAGGTIAFEVEDLDRPYERPVGS